MRRWFLLERSYAQGDYQPWCRVRKDADRRELAGVIKMLHRAGDQRDELAQLDLGVMYENGQGVDQSEATAAKWYRKGTDQEDSQAQSNLGTMYQNCRGVGQSGATAVKWYRKAADQ